LITLGRQCGKLTGCLLFEAGLELLLLPPDFLLDPELFLAEASSLLLGNPRANLNEFSMRDRIVAPWASIGVDRGAAQRRARVKGDVKGLR